jgi:hypothetical protein
MANITILKHKRDKNFKIEFLKWVREKDPKTFGVTHDEIPVLFQILIKFSDEIDIVRSIQESSNFITDDGLHHIASKLLEEFIKQDTHYVILDNVEVFKNDHMLVVLTD